MENTAKIEIGYGMSKGAAAFATGAEAAQQAMAGIHQCPPSAVLVFASVCYNLDDLLQGIHSVVGEVPVLGTTTAGEICDGPQQESVVVVTLASAYLSVRAGVGEGVSENWQQAVNHAVSAPEVRPFFSSQNDALWSELTRQGKTAFALLFSPGNTRHADSRSYEVLEELKRLSQGMLPIFGGSSADDWRMEENLVLLGERAYPDSVLVAVFETHLRFGIGLAHGFRPGSQRATITRAQGHEVLELDDEPAAQVYARMLGSPPEALEDRLLTLTTGRPAGTSDPYGQYSINVASYFTPQGGVRFSQPTVEGVILTIMEPDQDDMIAAGREALRKALLRGGITNPAAALVCSCALRTRILGDRTEDEIAGMREMLPGVPLAGFYSLGEQGLADDGVNRHNNGVVAVLVLGQDLSHAAQVALENERLRAVLQRNEERFRVLVESMDDVVFTLDREHRHTGVFGRWIERSGLTPETFLGKTAREILGAEAAGIHEWANERALAGENVVYEWSVEGPGGTEFYQTSLSPIFAPEDVVVGIVGVGRDITARKRAEAQIHYQASLLDNVTDAVISTDMGFVIQSWNKAAEEMYGWKSHRVLGRHFAEIAHPEYPHSTREAVMREFMETGRYEGGVIHHRRDGTPIAIWEAISTIRDDRGNPVGVVSVNRDIAVRKRAEEQIAHLNRLQEELFSPSSLDEKLDRITNGVIAIFDADFARIWLAKPGDRCDSGCFHSRVTEGPHVCRFRDRCLHLVSSAGRYTHVDGEVYQRVPFGCYKIGLIATGQDSRLITNDVTQDPNIRDHDWAKELGLVSFAGYRLLSAIGDPIGVLALFSQRAISQDENALLEGLANATAQVIQTAVAEAEREKLIGELENTLAQVKTLSGLLPICASCKKIRDDKGYWTQVEVYVRDHSEAKFTHGFCPECAERLYPNYQDEEEQQT